MKFYRIDFGDCEGFKAERNETTVAWATSKKEAERIARENHDGHYLSRVTEIEVPTSKAGLKAFLNEAVWR